MIKSTRPWKKSYYFAAASERSFDEVCDTLRQYYELPKFDVDGKSNWTYAYVENESIGLNVTRADDYKTIESWIPGTPVGTNFQFILNTKDGGSAASEFVDFMLARLGLEVHEIRRVKA